MRSSVVMASLVGLVAIVSAGCGSSWETASSHEASLAGIDKTSDSADTHCNVVLRRMSRTPNSTGGYQTHNNYNWVWTGIIDMSKDAAAASAVPAVLYHYGSDATWHSVDAVKASESAGFVRYLVDIWDGLPSEGMSGTSLSRAQIRVIPYLRWPEGGRLFDHNRIADPTGTYLMTGQNGLQVAEDASVCPAESSPALPAVQLYYAKAFSSYSGTNGTAAFLGYVELQNFDYQKQVSVVYRVDTASNWTEVPAYYVRSLADNRELWAFKTGGDSFYEGINFMFYVKYTVNGATYYDNNNDPSSNYRVGTGARCSSSELVLGKSVFALNNLTASASSDGFNLFGDLILKNLAYEKKVTMVYSTDNWKTVQSLGAYYAHASSSAANTEFWFIQGKLPASAARMRFAISYEVAGATYWDNNFGNDYVLSLPGALSR